MRHMEKLKLAAAAGCIRGQEWGLRPAQNGSDRDLLWRGVGQGDVFFRVPIIHRIRLQRQAITEVLYVALNVQPAAGQDDGREHKSARQSRDSEPASSQAMVGLLLQPKRLIDLSLHV